jgi:flavin-dependent dehydrogenase
VAALNGFEIPKPQAHLIPLGGPARVPTVSKRVMLAGDCAGFAEPLLGEGIYFSILGGQIAANIARMACQRDKYDEAFLRKYEKECHEAFGRDFDVAYRVACFSYLEEYDMDRVVQFFFRDKRVRECMIGLMNGSIRYRDAKLKLAWPYFKYRLAKLGVPFYR